MAKGMRRVTDFCLSDPKRSPGASFCDVVRRSGRCVGSLPMAKPEACNQSEARPGLVPRSGHWPWIVFSEGGDLCPCEDREIRPGTCETVE